MCDREAVVYFLHCVGCWTGGPFQFYNSMKGEFASFFTFFYREPEQKDKDLMDDNEKEEHRHRNADRN